AGRQARGHLLEGRVERSGSAQFEDTIAGRTRARLLDRIHWIKGIPNPRDLACSRRLSELVLSKKGRIGVTWVSRLLRCRETSRSRPRRIAALRRHRARCNQPEVRSVPSRKHYPRRSPALSPISPGFRRGRIRAGRL